MYKKIICLGILFVLLASIFCGCGGSPGSFYSLKEAYENGWLTQEDLKNLAYYYNGKNDDSAFVPSPKNPETLPESVEKKIKQTHLTDIKEDVPEAKISGIQIITYYGTYSGCVAVFVTDSYIDLDIAIAPEYIVGGVVFYNFSVPRLQIWRENS